MEAVGVEPEGLGGSQFDMSCRRGAQHKFDVTNHGRCVQSAPKFIAKADPTPASKLAFVTHGSLNVPIEHHPTIRYVVYNGYYKVMSNIPKMGQLPTPVRKLLINHWMSMRLGEPYFLTTSLQNQRL